jgi:membrane-bound ClpP family serine protease
LESGILGALVMILWFALDSVLERQYWWAMLNLWGAAAYHNRVFSMGLGLATLAGAAMHFFLHGVAGALWGVLGGRIANYWQHLLASFAAAAGVYFLLMHAFWPVVAPVVSRITPLPATVLAYFLFGAAISRNAHRARQLGMIWET